MKIRYLFLLISILSLSVSCFIRKRSSIPDIKGTKWVLVSLSDSLANANGSNSSLYFESNNEIHAVAVCNTIAGRYTADPGKRKLNLSALLISYLGCRDLKTEAILLSALKATNKYTIKEDTLLLLKDKKILATYKRVEHL